MTKRRTAAEIIAFHFCSDIRDVQSCRYQPTRYTAPALYTIGDHYYCSPLPTQTPPKPWRWEKIGTHYGRDVMRAHMNDIGER